MNTELSICEASSPTSTGRVRTTDYYFNVKPVCNQQVQKMWSRTIRVGPASFLRPAYLMFKALGLNQHIIQAPAEDRDIRDRLLHYPPHLKFTREENALGRIQVAELLGDANAEWVCLHQRDAAYLSETLSQEDWSYHSYRDTPIGDYSLVAEELASRGYFVVRMGKVTEEPLLADNDRIIDYGRHPLRSDFLDVYLGAGCRFFLSTGSGIDSVATVFRRPQVLVNFPLPFHPLISNPHHVFIYQHFFDRENDEPMSLAELKKRGAESFFSREAFQSGGVRLVRNSPEEIRDAAVEMDERIKGTWMDSNTSVFQQAAFWSAFPRIPSIHGAAPFRARIGCRFLEANGHLSIE